MMKKLLLTAMAIATTIGAIAQVPSPTGAINGRFSVAADKQVYFSQGNLQCTNPKDAATRTWAFAEHQYDRIGTANLKDLFDKSKTKVGVLFGSTIDLFGWSANNTTAPFGISLSQNAADYAGDFVDWGTNAITNGGNQPNLWRTLSQAEWIYLFSGRPNAKSLYSGATVNNINGIVVLPDAFVCPATVMFNAQSTNTYTTTDWETMEQAGAVFLPTTGAREKNSTSGFIEIDEDILEMAGFYWSSTSEAINSALYTEIWDSEVSHSYFIRHEGIAVRLVQEISAITIVDAEHGTISADKTYALAGETITITATPDAGYTLQGLAVQQGTTAIELTPVVGQDGQYTFTMPSGLRVEVKATFFRLSDYKPQPISVGLNHQVYFSPGNLQFNAIQGTHKCADGETQQGTWRFAENQYDEIGGDNRNLSATYDGYIDLFGWGTSGYDNTTQDPLAINYQPWASSKTKNDANTDNPFGYGPSGNMPDRDMAGSSANYDWGVYNAISNGGNQPKQWRTLTHTEWSHIMSGRTNADQLHSIGTVNNINGMIILPDAFQMPSTLSWTPKATDYATNTYTAAQWKQLEQMGAVFLPRTHVRIEKNIFYAGEGRAGYWLSTNYGTYSTHACYAAFSPSSVGTSSAERWGGNPVRLVQDLPIAPSYQPKPISVAENKKVCFAPGNLQCTNRNATPMTWEFSEYQYDIVGNQNITYILKNTKPLTFQKALSDKIDLLGWSADQANTLFGTIPSTDRADYAANEFLDWGENIIGTEPADEWYTLSSEEWNYIFMERTNATQLFGFGSVNGINGLIILPDAWTTPAGITFNSAATKNIPLNDMGSGYENEDNDNYTHNTYTIYEWALMEQAGAVFLPAGGERNGLNLSEINTSGNYWSASFVTNAALCMNFNNSILNPMLSSDRPSGYSVRLAQEYMPTIIIQPTANGTISADRTKASAGEVVTITVTPDETYKISTLSVIFGTTAVTLTPVAGEENKYQFTMPAGNVEVSVTFILEYVDLALPSKVLWATTNIGANTPYEYGDYFAWGETTPRTTGFGWTNYTYSNDDGSVINKYNTTDGKTQLDSDDDAATQQWGAPWCMPTQANWQELIDNCDWTWTDDYQGTGIMGNIVASRTNSHAIFLPAGGAYLDNSLSFGNTSGFFWSSTLTSDEAKAYKLTFNAGTGTASQVTDYMRWAGISVRAIRETPHTAVEQTDASAETQVRKIVYDGQVFIIRGNQIFTVMGQKVK